MEKFQSLKQEQKKNSTNCKRKGNKKQLKFNKDLWSDKGFIIKWTK